MWRKTKCSGIILAVGTVCALLLLTPRIPRDKPLSISFAGYTNVPDSVRPFAVFVATNTTSKTLTYATHVERKTEAGWPVHSGLEPYGDVHDIPVRQEFKFLERPPIDNEPWRVCVIYSLPDDRWAQIRKLTAEFLRAHNLPAAARRLYRDPQPLSAVGPEMLK
jgi:hypothetical protein